jgi:hypothetical protein
MEKVIPKYHTENRHWHPTIRLRGMVSSGMPVSGGILIADISNKKKR